MQVNKMTKLMEAKKRETARQIEDKKILDSTIMPYRHKNNELHLTQEKLPTQLKDAPLKRVLGLLQPYDTQKYGTTYVRMPMGGRERIFSIKQPNMPTMQKQPLIGTRAKDYKNKPVSDDYDSLAKVLAGEKGHRHNIRNAKLILEALNSPLNKQPNFEKEKLTAQEINAAVKLIAITHIAEPAPARSPSMGKFTRGELLKIADPKKKDYTFHKVFNRKNGTLRASQKGGTKKARIMTQNPNAINTETGRDMTESSELIIIK
ncbi:MAG: hypothetical protein WC860_05795 [Candidatus Margulisiibacteriota bacterium]|jgi:hypothetical protein